MFGFEDIIVGIAFFVAMTVQGVTGFGGSVVCSSVVTSIYGPALAVPIMAMSGHPINGPLCIKQWKMIDWKSLGRIVAFALPGLLVGNFLFKELPPVVAKISIGAFVTIIACQGIYKSFLKEKIQAAKEGDDNSPFAKFIRVFCLIAGGVAQGAFNVGGPLITVFTLSAVKDKTRFRATMCAFWMVLNSVTMFNHWRAGFWTGEFWVKFGICLPFMVGGFLVGCFLHNKVNQQLFLKIVYIVLFFVGAQMFLSNVMTLF